MARLPEKEVPVDQWLIRARRGDRAAFDRLIHQFESKVMRLACYLTRNWADAEDVAQEVYVKMIEKAPTLRSWDRLEGWVMKVTVTTARDFQRRQRRWLPLPKFLGRVRPARAVESREIRGRLHSGLASLSFSERAAFVLCEVQGFSTTDVSQVLGCRPATVRGYLLTARRKLQRRLGDWGRGS